MSIRKKVGFLQQYSLILPEEGLCLKKPPFKQPSNIKVLLRGDCEVEKIMKFLKEIEMFEEI